MAGAVPGPPGASGGGSESSGAWKRALFGRPEWVSPSPSPADIEALSARFPDAVVLPEESWAGEAALWSAAGVVAKSLGRWVSTETLAREFRSRAGLAGVVSGAYLDHGFMAFRMQSEQDRDLVLARPWVVAGQAVAVERWRPGFFPVEDAVSSALVWVRLPHLPVELWGADAIRAILRPAGVLVALDECTEARKRLGFARACLRLDLSSPLRPGTLVQGPAGRFWQMFIFEGINGICCACGRFHAADVCRPGAGGDGAPADGPSSSSPPLLRRWCWAPGPWPPGSGGPGWSLLRSRVVVPLLRRCRVVGRGRKLWFPRGRRSGRSRRRWPVVVLPLGTSLARLGAAPRSAAVVSPPWVRMGRYSSVVQVMGGLVWATGRSDATLSGPVLVADVRLTRVGSRLALCRLLGGPRLLRAGSRGRLMGLVWGGLRAGASARFGLLFPPGRRWLGLLLLARLGLTGRLGVPGRWGMVRPLGRFWVLLRWGWLCLLLLMGRLGLDWAPLGRRALGAWVVWAPRPSGLGQRILMWLGFPACLAVAGDPGRAWGGKGGYLLLP